MMSKLSWRIGAGALCIAGALGGRASAAEVYPGCAVPPTTFNHIWYIDPVNGKTAAEGGLGTRAAPWNSLQAVFSVQPGYKAPLLSTASYRRPNPAAPGAGPIEPGDEILLMSGNYGDVSTSDWNVGLKNPAFVTIAAAPGQTPVLSFLGAVASSYLVFSGIKVEGTADSSPLHARFPLVKVSPWGSQTGSNLVFTNMRLTSADDTSGWTLADWRAKRRRDALAGFSPTGAPPHLAFQSPTRTFRTSNSARPFRRTICCSPAMRSTASATTGSTTMRATF